MIYFIVITQGVTESYGELSLAEFSGPNIFQVSVKSFFFKRRAVELCELSQRVFDRQLHAGGCRGNKGRQTTKTAVDRRAEKKADTQGERWHCACLYYHITKTLFEITVWVEGGIICFYSSLKS